MGVLGTLIGVAVIGLFVWAIVLQPLQVTFSRRYPRTPDELASADEGSSETDGVAAGDR